MRVEVLGFLPGGREALWSRGVLWLSAKHGFLPCDTFSNLDILAFAILEVKMSTQSQISAVSTFVEGAPPGEVCPNALSGLGSYR